MIDTIKERENLYMTLHELDFNGKAGKKLKAMGYKKRVDGRWERSVSAGWDGPWIHQHRIYSRSRDCELWHNVFFSLTGLTPTYCKDCWKVVINVPTVEQLFNLYELQKGLNHTCKCGLELRSTDERLYGGYFYNDSKEEGLACLEKVRNALAEKELPMEAFLKCACSEYEITNGPPEDYVPTDNQLKLEKMYIKYVVPCDTYFEQNKDDVAYTMIKWIHYAASHGDLTYKKFTGGESILPQMKKYEKENGNGEDSE